MLAALDLKVVECVFVSPASPSTHRGLSLGFAPPAYLLLILSIAAHTHTFRRALFGPREGRLPLFGLSSAVLSSNVQHA